MHILAVLRVCVFVTVWLCPCGCDIVSVWVCHFAVSFCDSVGVAVAVSGGLGYDGVIVNDKPLFVRQPELLDSVHSFAARGLRPSKAARAAGVSDRSWARWWAQGQEDYERGLDTVYADLFRRVSGAYEGFIDGVELHVMAMFGDNKVKDWRGWAWFLKATRPDVWGENSERDEMSQEMQDLMTVLDKARKERELSDEGSG